jgi:hypothetical protein
MRQIVSVKEIEAVLGIVENEKHAVIHDQRSCEEAHLDVSSK